MGELRKLVLRLSRNDPALTKLELNGKCVSWETIAFLCPREKVRESENALHLRADSGSTFAELRVLDRSYPHRGEDLTFEKSRNSDVQWITHCASCFQEPR